MPTVTYIESNGNRIEVDVPVGTSVMQAGIDNGIEGIVGECCGSLACATCHCYIDDAWVERLTPASTMEKEMLDCSPLETKSSSRLTCQIQMTDELSGIVVHCPESQF